MAKTKMDLLFKSKENPGGADFFRIPKSIITDFVYPDISANAFRVYVTLCYYWNYYNDPKAPDREYIYISNEDLAKACKVSTKTLFKAKKELVEAGFISCWLQGEVIGNEPTKPNWHKCHYKVLK